MNREILREKLAEIEHNQWMDWTKATIDKTNIIDGSGEASFLLDCFRRKWEPNWKPYDQLTEAEKDKDREYADKVLRTLEANGLQISIGFIPK
jgi:hypothetical protein